MATALTRACGSSRFPGLRRAHPAPTARGWGGASASGGAAHAGQPRARARGLSRQDAGSAPRPPPPCRGKPREGSGPSPPGSQPWGYRGRPPPPWGGDSVFPELVSAPLQMGPEEPGSPAHLVPVRISRFLLLSRTQAIPKGLTRGVGAGKEGFSFWKEAPKGPHLPLTAGPSRVAIHPALWALGFGGESFSRELKCVKGHFCVRTCPKGERPGVR